MRHVDASGAEILSESEEEGDGLRVPGQGGDEDDEDDEEDEDEEDEESEEESDDEDEDLDPFAAIFGGGRRRHRRPTARGGASRSAMRQSMFLVHERPGQLLRRDKRLRLKPSTTYPVRCWRPRADDADAACMLCGWRVASRLGQGWTLACLACAQKRKWARGAMERGPRAAEHDDDESASARRARLSSASHAAYVASTFPNYRAGLACCSIASCASHKLLLVYDEHDDEYVVCAACKSSKQKLRYYDQSQHRLIDAVQEPLTQH